MKTAHETTIHVECPHGGWNYYTAWFSPDEFLTCEDFQDTCDKVRGGKAYQEDVTKKLASLLPPGELRITGDHGHRATCTQLRTTIVRPPFPGNGE